jgi:hypothetical protein
MKKETYEDGKPKVLVGHPDIHRVIKDLVKFDQSLENSNLEFSKKLAGMMVKQIRECLETRGVWVLVALLESERTSSLVKEELKKE